MSISIAQCIIFKSCTALVIIWFVHVSRASLLLSVITRFVLGFCNLTCIEFSRHVVFFFFCFPLLPCIGQYCGSHLLVFRVVWVSVSSCGQFQLGTNLEVNYLDSLVQFAALSHTHMELAGGCGVSAEFSWWRF